MSNIDPTDPSVLADRVQDLERRLAALELRHGEGGEPKAFGLTRNQIQVAFYSTIQGDSGRERRKETGLTGYELFAFDLETMARERGWTPPEKS